MSKKFTKKQLKEMNNSVSAGSATDATDNARFNIDSKSTNESVIPVSTMPSKPSTKKGRFTVKKLRVR